MALDLVRWSSLRASLVKARNEAHLLRTLDELADPSECTWQRYEGPLWVDFEVPAKFEVQPTGRSRLELSDVQVSLPAHDWAEPLRIVSAESETEAEMLHAILEDAFPSIAEVIDASGADDPSKSELESAIVRELVEHHNRTAKQGVTFESDADGDLELRATRFQYFLWKETRFEPIDDEIIDAFLFGERSMEGGVDHKVRLASAAIALHQGKPQLSRACIGGRSEFPPTELWSNRIEQTRFLLVRVKNHHRSFAAETLPFVGLLVKVRSSS